MIEISFTDASLIGLSCLSSRKTPSQSFHNVSAMQANLGGLLAWEFLLFHWVEVRRWQDIQNHHSVDEDPIFKGNKARSQICSLQHRVSSLSAAVSATASCNLPVGSFRPWRHWYLYF